jgi:hypothetical protein
MIEIFLLLSKGESLAKGTGKFMAIQLALCLSALSAPDILLQPWANPGPASRKTKDHTDRPLGSEAVSTRTAVRSGEVIVSCRYKLF